LPHKDLYGNLKQHFPAQQTSQGWRTATASACSFQWWKVHIRICFC